MALSCPWGRACLLAAREVPATGCGSLPDASPGTPAPGLPAQAPLPARGAGGQTGDPQTGPPAQPSAAWPLPAPRTPQCTLAPFSCQLGSAALLLLSTPLREEAEE